jgi:hypothetical protein
LISASTSHTASVLRSFEKDAREQGRIVARRAAVLLVREPARKTPSAVNGFARSVSSTYATASFPALREEQNRRCVDPARLEVHPHGLHAHKKPSFTDLVVAER